MPVKSEPWAEGTPAWVDVMVSDLNRSKEFYGQVSAGSSRRARPSSGATRRLVSGAMRSPAWVRCRARIRPPPAWTTYLASDALDATLAKITEAGGQVFVPAMEIGDFGGMAVVADPTGAVFGLWKSGTHTGFDLFNDPGAVVWNEGMVGDLEAARHVLRRRLRLHLRAGRGGHAVRHGVAERPAGVRLGSIELAGPGIPPHWRTYFAVADADATCAKVNELGGHVVAEPWATPFGKMAAVSGPDDEVFLLNEGAPQTDA